MDQVTLRATARPEIGTRPSRRLRREGRVPAVVYGSDLEPVSVAVDGRELYASLHTEAGANAIFNLDVEGKSHLTVAREIQRDPVRGVITHVDFIQIRLDVAIEAEVGLEFVGEPLGVKQDGGFVEAIEVSVNIEALPSMIPPSITVDISALGIGDLITVADLPAVEGVTYLDDADKPIVTVAMPRAGVEEGELEAGVTGEGAEEGEEPSGSGEE